MDGQLKPRLISLFVHFWWTYFVLYYSSCFFECYAIFSREKRKARYTTVTYPRTLSLEEKSFCSLPFFSVSALVACAKLLAVVADSVDRWGLCSTYVILIQVGCPSSASKWRFSKCMLATPEGWLPLVNMSITILALILTLEAWIIHTGRQGLTRHTAMIPQYQKIKTQNNKQSHESKGGQTLFALFVSPWCRHSKLWLWVSIVKVFISNNKDNVILRATDSCEAWLQGTKIWVYNENVYISWTYQSRSLPWEWGLEGQLWEYSGKQQ